MSKAGWFLAGAATMLATFGLVDVLRDRHWPEGGLDGFDIDEFCYGKGCEACGDCRICDCAHKYDSACPESQSEPYGQQCIDLPPNGGYDWKPEPGTADEQRAESHAHWQALVAKTRWPLPEYPESGYRQQLP